MDFLFSVAEIRAIESSVASQLPTGTLMQRAGRAAAAQALQLVAGQAEPSVLCLAGPGNNGGDAFEVAANLADAGIDVAIWHLPGTGETSEETSRALQRAQASTARWIEDIVDGQWALVVDGLFGIGLSRPLTGPARQAVADVSALSCPILALDIPSGLDADTGAVVGPDGIAMRATHTITFIGDKPGLHTCDGRDTAGLVSVETLGIPFDQYPAARAGLNGPALFASCLRPRSHNSHKGSFGNVAIVGGAAGMVGAAVLAGRAALYGGAGRVYLCMLDAAVRYDSQQPELMFRDAYGFDVADKVVVAGPGMGEPSPALLARALDAGTPNVLDADALNQIAGDTALQDQLCQRFAPSVLTPHPLEAARLLGITASAVQADRLAAARALARLFNAFVVLKGSGSVMARPDGHVVINTTGNPGLATAGSGDILAGLCGSLLAQGWPAWEALLGAVWIHGKAADMLVDQGVGPIGLTASELAPACRAVLSSLIRGGPPQS
jgi:hydroxyethylthiazole kinase-like uncharacterized protein yjeF